MLTNPSGTNAITGDIIGCAIKVHKALGPGLLESAYSPCLALELRDAGHTIELKKPVPLIYRNIRINVCFYVDLVVDGQVLVELKSVAELTAVHEAQLLTYLRLTHCPVGLLINFNVPVLKDGVKRKINKVEP